MAMVSFEERLVQRARGKQPSVIRELLGLASLDDMVSLGGGYPNPSTFIFSSVEARFKGTDRTIRLDGDELIAASQYGPSRVDARLDPQLRKWHRAKGGVEISDGGLCVLNGSQEGLFILAYLLVEAGTPIVVSEPTYPGAISAFSSFGASYLSVPLDAQGLDTVALAELLEKRRQANEPSPAFIYCIPNGHNPGGVSLSVERRRHLIAVANEHDLLVVEDDPYQLISYDGPTPPSLQELDTQGRVIRLDSFSKIFVPGFRIGYVSGDPKIIRQFELFKQSSNLHTTSFNQRLLAAYLETSGPEEFLAHIQRNVEFYRLNRDAMVEASEEFLGDRVRYEVPKSGLFIWFRLPEGCDAGVLHERYTEKMKVLLVPGYGFSTVKGLRNCMRASFGTVSPERIREGIRRFGLMLEAYDEMG